jgi:hypothetical protein
MRFCALLGLASVALGQTVNTSASVNLNWELASSWNDGVIPLDVAIPNFSEVVIEGGAQVFLNAGGLFTVFNPIRLGSSLAANAAVDAMTSITLTSRVLSATALTWNRGSIVMNGTNAKFWVSAGALPAQTGEVSCEGNNVRVVQGGTFSLTAAPLTTKTVWVKAGSLEFANAHLDFDGNEISVASQATVSFTGQCAVDSVLVLRGAGEAVIAATADLAVGAALTVSATKTSVKGNLTLATGQAVTVAGAGAELVVETGARVQRTVASTTVHVTVQADATLRFAAGAMAAASASVEGGLVDVRSGARAVINAGVSVVASHITFQSNASLNIAFGAGTAQATGTLTIAAGAVLRLDGAEPKARVVLATAATITGTFEKVYVNGQLLASASASAGRRLLAGTVVYNNNTIEYQPGESSSAAKSYLVALIAPVALLFW